MKRRLTSRFETVVIFGFGRYAANFSAVTGLVLGLVGAATVIRAYPERQLAENPANWITGKKVGENFPEGNAYPYERSYPKEYSLEECFGKNSVGVTPMDPGDDMKKWNASLFGEAMNAFSNRRVVSQTSNVYDEYTLDQSSNVPEGIAEMARGICANVLAKSTATKPHDVFWETREPVLLADAEYGKYFDGFNKKEDERKATLVPGAVALITGVLVAFLGSMASSLFAIERNTRSSVSE